MKPNVLIKMIFRLLLILALSAFQPIFAADLNAAKKAVRMQDFQTAFSLFSAAANSGDAEAQYQLALLYSHGRGTQKSDDKAQQWLEKAAAQNHPGAQYTLGAKIKDSQPQRAMALFESSASSGYGPAIKQLERAKSADALASNAKSVAQDVLWFGAARSNDLNALQRLKAEGFDINFVNKSGGNALFTAIESGNHPAAKWLIKNGIDISHKDNFGSNAAQLAVERAQLETLKSLFDAGIDPQQSLNNGDNLLHLAVRHKRLETARYLILKGVSLNHQNKEGWTPLDLAEYKDLPKFASIIANKGGKHGKNWQHGRKGVDVTQLANQLKNQGGRAPELLAIANSNKALLLELLKQNPDQLNARYDDGSTLLTTAAKQNKTEIIEALVALGADVNLTGFQDTTPLQTAVHGSNLAAINTLLKAGADPLQKNSNDDDAISVAIEREKQDIALALFSHLIDESETPRAAKRLAEEMRIPVDRYLLLATQHHQTKMLERLLPLAGTTTAKDDLGRNALWFAAKEKNTALVESLLKAGVDARQKDHLGLTPFLVAVESECLDCARKLFIEEYIDETTKSGNTALHIASQKGNTLLAAWLVQNKANIEARNQRGDTPIMEAVNARSTDVVRVLLKANANVTRKNKLGFSAIDLAKQVSPEMEKLVKSKSVLGIF